MTELLLLIEMVDCVLDVTACGVADDDHIRPTPPCSQNTPLIMKIFYTENKQYSYWLGRSLAHTLVFYFRSHSPFDFITRIYTCSCLFRRPASMPLFHFHYIYIHSRVFRLVLGWCQRSERTTKNKMQKRKTFCMPTRRRRWRWICGIRCVRFPNCSRHLNVNVWKIHVPQKLL